MGFCRLASLIKKGESLELGRADWFIIMYCRVICVCFGGVRRVHGEGK